jgi:hypothetical protein
MIAAKNITFVIHVYCKNNCQLWELAKQYYDKQKDFIVPIKSFNVTLTPFYNTPKDLKRESQKGLTVTYELEGMLKNEHRYVRSFRKEHTQFINTVREYVKPFGCVTIPRKTKLGSWGSLFD